MIYKYYDIRLSPQFSLTVKEQMYATKSFIKYVRKRSRDCWMLKGDDASTFDVYVNQFQRCLQRYPLSSGVNCQMSIIDVIPQVSGKICINCLLTLENHTRKQTNPSFHENRYRVSCQYAHSRRYCEDKPVAEPVISSVTNPKGTEYQWRTFVHLEDTLEKKQQKSSFQKHWHLIGIEVWIQYFMPELKLMLWVQTDFTPIIVQKFQVQVDMKVIKKNHSCEGSKRYYKNILTQRIMAVLQETPSNGCNRTACT